MQSGGSRKMAGTEADDVDDDGLLTFIRTGMGR
jgi:hypothetical protein